MLEHRCLGRRTQRGRTDRGSDPGALAQGRDPAPGRFRLCPGRAHGVVRREPGRLPVRAGPQRSPDRRHRRRPGRSRGREPGQRWPRAPLRRLRLAHAGPLAPRAAGRCQGRAPAQGAQPALRRHLAASRRDRWAHPVRGPVLRPRAGREPDVWTPPACKQVSSSFRHAWSAAAMYPASLGYTPAGLDEFRELAPDYQGELEALWFSRALPTPVRPACHRVKEHPRSLWRSRQSRFTQASIRPPRDRLRRGSALPRPSGRAYWPPPLPPR